MANSGLTLRSGLKKQETTPPRELVSKKMHKSKRSSPAGNIVFFAFTNVKVNDAYDCIAAENNVGNWHLQVVNAAGALEDT